MTAREGRDPVPLAEVPGLPVLAQEVAKRRGYRFVPPTCVAHWWTESAICFSIAGRDDRHMMTVPRAAVAATPDGCGGREPVVKAYCFSLRERGVA